jgi:2-polyprenyl-3-methyl-5-hydroxy-6-metoxy-1,4-benzoquinol methylase
MTVRTDDSTQKADAFAANMLAALNNSATVLMLSIGHRTRLFQVMSTLPPVTSGDLANAAGLQERYVREWLGNMVVSRIVDYDPTTREYALPAEHAMFLTPDAGPNNMAAYADAIPAFAGVVGQVADCFRTGGGVPYSAVPNVQEVIAGLTNPLYDAYLIQSILPLVGLDERLNVGVEVADIGCGQGHAVNLMARAYPESRFIGFDFSEDGIAAARTEAESWRLNNASFEVKDVARLGVSNRFDVMTSFDAIHDQAEPDKVLRDIWEALKPGGLYFMLDEAGSSLVEENLDHPLGPFLYAASVLHCMTVSLSQGGAGLGTMWGEQTARRMLGEAGFTNVRTKKFEPDIEHVYYTCTK